LHRLKQSASNHTTLSQSSSHFVNPPGLRFNVPHSFESGERDYNFSAHLSAVNVLVALHCFI
jgi:hypothetical protein